MYHQWLVDISCDLFFGFLEVFMLVCQAEGFCMETSRWKQLQVMSGKEKSKMEAWDGDKQSLEQKPWCW